MIEQATGTIDGLRCRRCHRPITSARSLRSGAGRWCKALMQAEAAAQLAEGYTAEQIGKAEELLADGGLVPTKRPGVYRAVSSRGDAAYLLTAGFCSCPAGQRGRRCYHRAAVAILTAPTRKAA